MAAILAGRMVNADSAITGEFRRPMRREYGRQTVGCWRPERSAPMKGKGPSVSLVSEVSGFLSPEWNPFFIIFFTPN